MKTVFIALIALIVCAMGAEQLKPENLSNPVAVVEASKPKPISEIDALKLEIVSLRLELMQRDRNEIIRSICESAKVPLDKCFIDPAKRTLSSKPSEE